MVRLIRVVLLPKQILKEIIHADNPGSEDVPNPQIDSHEILGRSAQAPIWTGEHSVLFWANKTNMNVSTMYFEPFHSSGKCQQMDAYRSGVFNSDGQNQIGVDEYGGTVAAPQKPFSANGKHKGKPLSKRYVYAMRQRRGDMEMATGRDMP
uniref:Astacin domain-containing protein n=1 Tax=Steinernema glaseri TaxID=37863 RepID=A0A1I7ZID2_9BILA